MPFTRLFLASIGLCISVEGALAQDTGTVQPPGVIVANQSGDRTYHHITFNLTPDDLVLDQETMSRALAYMLTDGGQFEIYVRPNLLPIETPTCEGGVIVRMPWTIPTLSDADEAVAEKAALLAEFDALRAGQTAMVQSTIELDPYLTIDDAGQPLALTQCNVFFRHASGRYIDHNSALTAN